MACLFGVLRTKVRHMAYVIRSKNDIIAFRDKTRIVVFWGITAYVMWNIDNEVPLIPKADKYLLTGEDNVVRKVKNQIVAEDKYTTVEKCMMRSKNVDIQILDKTRPYKPPNEDKLKKIELLLCLSTTSRKEVTHWLPDTLPPNVKCKYILVEKLPGEYHLSEDLEDDLKKNPQISKLFTDPAIKSLPPIISPEYNNTKISDSARDSLFFTYTVVMSLYIALVNLRLSRFVPK